MTDRRKHKLQDVMADPLAKRVYVALIPLDNAIDEMGNNPSEWDDRIRKIRVDLSEMVQEILDARRGHAC